MSTTVGRLRFWLREGRTSGQRAADFVARVGGTRPLKSDIMSGMQIIRAVIVVCALSAVALATSACPEKGPAEKAGEKIDNAVDKTKDAAKDATK